MAWLKSTPGRCRRHSASINCPRDLLYNFAVWRAAPCKLNRNWDLAMPEQHWIDIGSTEDLSERHCGHSVSGQRPWLSFKDGQFGVVSNVCNHVGGPLGEGRLDGDYIVCPWHNWKFHRCTGKGEPGFEEERVPAYAVKVENGRVLIDLASATKRTESRTAASAVAQDRTRPGPLRLAGISTTAMDEANPRFSGSDHLLDARARRRRQRSAPRRR